MSASDLHRFSALYIEREARGLPNAERLVRAFSDRPIVEIESAAEIFHRRNQDFALQKRHQALIAARSGGPFLYQTPEFVSGTSQVPVLYSDQLRNCVFDCDYCFLQGMNQSAHLLANINSPDYHTAARERAKEGPYWLSISYLSDALAIEESFPLVSEWIGVVSGVPEVTLEVRTKGALPAVIVEQGARPNVVLTWTVTPDRIAGRYERGTAPVNARLAAASHALERGFRVRLAFDPVLLVPGWRDLYSAFIESAVPPLVELGLESASYGPFRIPASYLLEIERDRADAPILHHPFSKEGDVSSYSAKERAAIDEVVGEPLRRLVPDVMSFT